MGFTVGCMVASGFREQDVHGAAFSDQISVPYAFAAKTLAVFASSFAATSGHTGKGLGFRV